MLTEVTQAMVAAAQCFVNMDELMEGVGQQLGNLTGSGVGIVTSGAAASLCHATAAFTAQRRYVYQLELSKEGYAFPELVWFFG